jgi:hypothetical protein
LAPSIANTSRRRAEMAHQALAFEAGADPLLHLSGGVLVGLGWHLLLA